MFMRIFKEEKGFTMIELIIVIAIIAIIGAILAPNFNSITTKAKVKADIDSAREVCRQASLYNAERGEYPKGNSEVAFNQKANTGGLKELVDENYLEISPSPQTKGVIFSYNENNGKCILKKGASPAPNDEVIEAVSNLTTSERQYVTGLPW